MICGSFDIPHIRFLILYLKPENMMTPEINPIFFKIRSFDPIYISRFLFLVERDVHRHIHDLQVRKKKLLRKEILMTLENCVSVPLVLSEGNSTVRIIKNSIIIFCTLGAPLLLFRSSRRLWNFYRRCHIIS